MIGDRVLRWLLLVVLTIGIVGFVAIWAGQRANRTRDQSVEGHKLFYHQSTQRSHGWLPDSPITDDCGAYLYRDFNANVAALAMLGERGVMPHTRRGFAAASESATLFAPTKFEVTVRACDNTLILVHQDLTLSMVELRSGDVSAISDHIKNAMATAIGTKFSLTAELASWAIDAGRTELEQLLEPYVSDCDSPQYEPARRGPIPGTRPTG